MFSLPSQQSDEIQFCHGLLNYYDKQNTETGKTGLWLRAMFEVGYTYGWRHEELPPQPDVTAPNRNRPPLPSLPCR
jgi:hypothetical protein